MYFKLFMELRGTAFDEGRLWAVVLNLTPLMFKIS